MYILTSSTSRIPSHDPHSNFLNHTRYLTHIRFTEHSHSLSPYRPLYASPQYYAMQFSTTTAIFALSAFIGCAVADLHTRALCVDTGKGYVRLPLPANEREKKI